MGWWWVDGMEIGGWSDGDGVVGWVWVVVGFGGRCVYMGFGGLQVRCDGVGLVGWGGGGVPWGGDGLMGRWGEVSLCSGSGRLICVG